MALTDHDTTSGLQEASETARQVGITLIPGIEFTARVRRGQLHVLGYGLDPEHDELQSTLEWLREGRRRRAETMLRRLREAGVDLPDALLQEAGAEESLGRPHFARAMIEAGYVASVEEAFERYLRGGRPGYVPRETLEAEDAIRLIRAAGGIAVLAHPLSVIDLDTRLPELIAAGLEGLEVHYGEYADAARLRLAALASDASLLVTGGSDYHGPGVREGRELGSVAWPASDLDRFLARIVGG